MHFRNDQKITLIFVSELLSTTTVREIKITRTVNDRAAYIVKGKRKEYYFDPKPDVLVFDGWSLPFTVDSEAKNGFNFITNSPYHLKRLLEAANTNEVFNQWHLIMYTKPGIKPEYKFLFKIEDE